MTGNDSVLLDMDARGLATVTLNRPDRHNAFDDGMIRRLADVFASLGENDTVRVVVIRGHGPGFSAGADAGWMRRSASMSHGENMADAMGLARMLHTLNTLPKPVIAAVNGAAIGGGVGLVACADVAIAVDDARFALSEVRLGLTPATISPYVVAAIGARHARRYFLTAERFDAATARDIGLVHEVVPNGDALDARVDSLVRALLANAPGAVAAAKDLVFAVAGRPVDDALLSDTARRIADRRTSPEGQEGLTAFLEKRKPGWAGEQ